MFRIRIQLQQEESRQQRIDRTRLRDESNPLELPDTLFIQHYRVNKAAFMYILEVLDNNIPTTRTSCGVTPIIKLCSCLRFFAEGGYQKGVARDYQVGMAQSTFCEVLSQVLDVLEEKLCGEWISYPTEEESRATVQDFYRKFGIPGVVGCIDGMHINIVAPKENKHLYYNRKGNYSLNATLICDSQMRIRFVDATHPGACHDSFVWNTSPYKSVMEQNFLQKDHRVWLLGHLEEQQPVVPTVKPMFSVGDRVKVCLEVDALMKLQQGHGGWNPRMVEHLSKLGTVHRITEKGDIRVQYENCPNRWTFHPAALVKVVSFRVGDLVTILNDAAKVQQLQKGHGEWIELMRYALGKLCKVIKVYSDGDLRIEQLDDGFEWTLNPKCVKLERSPLATAAERSNSMMDLSNRRTDHVMTPLSGLSGTSTADKLVREAAQGHIEFVKQYLDAHPDQVNVMSGGKACIQVAAHQGFVEIVKLLISNGANVNVVDKEGDSALHYAAFGNQPDTMRILLQNNANINFLNSSHCSALHICAHKKTPHCVRELLTFGADVNIQDSYGDTALHDAIGKENTEVVELLCDAPNLDFTVKNNRGFNVLHHAALKGNVVAARRILQLARQLVNVKKDDGFAALHLAALNGHTQVLEALIKEGQAEINIRNNRRQTPFLLAVSQGHSAAIEKLVKLGCDITARDEDGDNAMHLCVIKKANLLHAAEPTVEDSADIFAAFESLAHLHDDRLMYTILCYLSRLGCKIEQNNKGVNIFEWITDKNLKKLIFENQNTEIFVHTHMDTTAPSTSAAATTISADRLVENIQRLNLQVDDQSGTTHLNRLSRVNDEDILQSDKPTSSNHNQMPIISSNLLIRKQSSKASIPNINANNNDTAELKALILEPLTHKTAVIVSTTPQECIVCDETLQLLKFEPCQHQISCEDCGKRMKKCLRCGTQIERRIDCSGHILTNADLTNMPSADRLRYLENKIQEYEESHYCSICMERSRDVAFLCGHGACSRCAETLRTCHMCRKTILKKINLY